MNAPWKAGVGTREPFMAFMCDDAALDTVRSAVEDMGWQMEKCHKGGLRNAVQTLSVSASPNILLVDLSEAGDPLSDIHSLAEVCEPGTIVIASGQINDVRLYRDLMMSGIHDYLLKPFSPDALRDSLTQAMNILAAPRGDDGAAGHKHISTAVIGTRGGVGASTVATSLAWHFSAGMGSHTALLDLDVHFGTGALTMDLEPGRGLTDAIETPSRIDSLFLERAMLKANEKLSILSSEASIGSPIMTDGSAFFQLQEEFRAAFENTIVDMPRNMLINYPQLLVDINVIVLVCEMTLASARDTIRILAWLRSNAQHCRVILVANKVQSANVEITRKDFEASVERDIDLMIPADAKAAATAAKLGQPLIEAVSSSKIAGSLRDLSNLIKDSVEDEETDKAGSGKIKGGKSALGGLKSLLGSKKK
jgi:pilus assembly protein CpaE